MSTTSTDTLQYLCRACMSTIGEAATTYGQCIYEKPYGLTTAEDLTIRDIFLQFMDPQIEVSIENQLPKIICNDCVQQLLNTYQFLETCKETNVKLLKLLREVNFISHGDVTEKDNMEEYVEDTAQSNSYQIEIEKIQEETDIAQTKDINALVIYEGSDNEQKSWPEFEEDPSYLMSDVDECCDDKEELFDNPYSDASENECDTEVIKSKSPELEQEHKSRLKRKTKQKISKEENKDGPISCVECDIVLKNVTLWREHMTQCHVEELGTECNESNKIGRPRKSHECEYCKKVFPKINAYKNHIRIHTGEEPYLCIECGKGFKVVSSLNTHMLRHRGDKTFQCPHCPKKFVCSSGLYGHSMVHNKERKYVCDICGSAFHMAYMLRKHNLYHNGIKNFPCEYCDLRFVTAEKQRRHMRTHTGEKPYRCKYCDRAFAQSNDCNKHLKQHLGENIYQCELCPLRFPLARDLRVHFASHKDDDDETRTRNLKAREEEETNLKIKLGIKEI